MQPLRSSRVAPHAREARALTGALQIIHRRPPSHPRLLPASLGAAGTVTTQTLSDSEDLFKSFLEEGVFGEPDEHDPDAAAAAAALGSGAGQFALRADHLASRVSTPSSGDVDSPEGFSPFTTAESTSASTSPPYSTMQPGHLPNGSHDVKPQLPFDWRTGTQGGPFTVDTGGGGGGPADFMQQQQHSPFLGMPGHGHSLPPGLNPYFAALSSSFPTQGAPEWPQTSLAHSYAGAPSPLLFQQHPSALSQSHSAAPGSLPMSFYANPTPPHTYAASPDQSLLSLHMSLEAQAQARLGGAASPEIGRAHV